jgi:hypothetical protein
MKTMKLDEPLQVFTGPLVWGKQYYVSADKKKYFPFVLQKLEISDLDFVRGEQPFEKRERLKKINQEIKESWADLRKNNMVYLKTY